MARGPLLPSDVAIGEEGEAGAAGHLGQEDGAGSFRPGYIQWMVHPWWHGGSPLHGPAEIPPA